MKILLISIIIVFPFYSFSFTWQWSNHIGGVGTDVGGISIDRNNNVYSFGTFSNDCYFISDTFFSTGLNDFFIAKFDANGTEMWAKTFGGNNTNGDYEFADALITDSENNVYLSGRFYGTLTIGTNSVSSIGNGDIFLAKLDLNGNNIWLKKMGSSGDDDSFALELDSSGNILITGISIGPGQFGSINISGGTFLAKYDTNGTCLSAKKIADGAYFSCIKCLGSNIILTGTTTNDTATVDTMTLIGTNFTDMLIGKFDSNANVLWMKRNGGNYDDYGTSLDIDNQGNIYNCGYFKDSINFNGTILTNGNRYDLFLSKFSSLNGDMIWVKQSNAVGTSFGASASAIEADSIGSTYVTGSFGGTANFDSISLTTANFKDAFIARYDSSGSCLGAENFGPAHGYNVKSDNSGSIYLSGDFTNSISIGSLSITSNGLSDMFIAKRTGIVGIENLTKSLENHLTIYANPSTGICFVTVPEEFRNENKLHLFIYDSSGRIVQQVDLDLNEDNIKLNFEKEAKGVYIVSIGSKTKKYMGKIIFE